MSAAAPDHCGTRLAHLLPLAGRGMIMSGKIMSRLAAGDAARRGGLGKAEHGSMTRRSSILWIALMAALTAAPAWAQDAPPTDQAAPKSGGKLAIDLGEGLLDDLTGDLFEGLESEVQKGLKEATPKAKPAPKEKPPAESDAPVPLPGEDIGEASNPILEIGRLMQHVERRLASEDAGAQTQAQQQQILDELARLIEQAQQPSQPDNSNNQAPQLADRSQENQQSQQQEGADGQPQEQSSQGPPGGNRPAGQVNDSEEGVREADVQEADPLTRSELIKSAWGHLPQHLREAMLNVPTGEYLPQYAPAIELYFKRLAEQYRQRP